MKQKVIFRILLLCIILFGIACGIIIFANKNKLDIDISERKYYTIDKNLYYTEELFEIKNYTKDKEIILQNYKIISQYMKEKYPDVQFYIYNVNLDNISTEMYGNAYQIIDSIIIPEKSFSFYINNNTIKDINVDFYSNDSNIRLPLMPLMEKIIPQVEYTIKENWNKMGCPQKVKCKYFFEYDNKQTYLKFEMNNGSYIKLAVPSCEIIDTYFFNGIIFD